MLQTRIVAYNISLRRSFDLWAPWQALPPLFRTRLKEVIGLDHL